MEGSRAGAEDSGNRLPVHGFVLAGGKSSRMGEDKALVRVGGRPMVEIAVEKLREFCAVVTIAGNREDLEQFGPVVRETRVGAGPAAGIEAGLGAASEEWAMFVPVDVPLIPGAFLRRWAEEALRAGMTVSYLAVGGKQPAFCMMRRESLGAFSRAMEGGERRLEVLLNRTAESDGYASWMYDENELYREAGDGAPEEETLRRWFKNVNTPGDLAEVEAWVGEAWREES